MSQLIPTTSNTKTVTDLRENVLGILRQLRKSGPTYILHRSEPRAVMLSVDEYVSLVEMVEDYFDTQVARGLEGRPEKGGKTIKQLVEENNIKI